MKFYKFYTVAVDKIRVEKDSFSFKYDFMVNGENVVIGKHYDSSHERSIKYMKKQLENGYAAQLVLEREAL
jgi:N-dimethylarginine dimethylaminohydrolase